MEEIVTQQSIDDAGEFYGMNIRKRPIKQQQMLTVMYQYRQGWIDEDDVEKMMTKIVRQKLK
jgi:hypothetical protein